MMITWKRERLQMRRAVELGSVKGGLLRNWDRAVICRARKRLLCNPRRAAGSRD